MKTSPKTGCGKKYMKKYRFQETTFFFRFHASNPFNAIESTCE